MKIPAIAVFVLVASCTSLSKLGGVFESTAYPAGGAAIGAAAGPLGAAAGAGVGHLVGTLATQADVVIVDGESMRQVYVKQTWRSFILENLLWILAAVYILHRCPWIPGWIWDKIKRKKREAKREKRQEPPGPPPSGYSGPGDIGPPK